MWAVTSACCNVISTLLVTTGTDWAADVGSDMGVCLYDEWRNTRLILQPGTRWSRMVSFTLRSLPPPPSEITIPSTNY
jgi:hypothetical protein